MSCGNLFTYKQKHYVFVLWVGILACVLIILKGILPVPVKHLVKERTILIWDYLTDYPGMVNTLAWVYGKTEYTPVGVQIGDDGPSNLAVLNDPTGIVGDEQGNIYIAERRNFRIRKISKGVISTIAGTGRRGFSGDGFSSRLARMNRPEGMDRDHLGNLYFADSFNHRIRKIFPNGTISTVAGTGIPGYSGDNGFAVRAQLSAPMDVKIWKSGEMYILERDNHCVRRVSPNGKITTLAGAGSPGFSGDGGLAIYAMLNTPYGIALDESGNVYVADSGNHRIRKITRDGIITTVAGTGQPGFAGDAGMAIQAQLNSPQSVLWTRNHELLIGDEHDHRIRKISSKGILTTIIGTGVPGFSGDGGPAIQAQLNDPEYLWEDKDGNLYISDGDNGRIRMVDTNGKIQTIAGGGEVKFQ